MKTKVYEFKDKGIMTKIYATRWQKYGHDRIYIDALIRAMKREVRLGYIDIKNNAVFIEEGKKQYDYYRNIVKENKEMIIMKVLEQKEKPHQKQKPEKRTWDEKREQFRKNWKIDPENPRTYEELVKTQLYWD